MEPLLKDGDMILVKPLDGNNIFLGDILAFRDKSSAIIIAHRLIKIVKSANGTLYILQGDANQEGVDEVGYNNIIGKVIGVKKKDRVVNSEWLPGIVLKYIWNRLPLSGGCIIFLLKWRSVWLISLIQIKTILLKFFLGRLPGLKIYRLLAKKICPLKLNIRVAQLTDLEQLKDLYQTNRMDMEKSLLETNRQGFFILAEEKRRGIVGSLALCRHNNTMVWLITGLQVKPFFRGLGIGEKIVKEAVVQAKKNRALRVGLFVNNQAVPAFNLYTKIGFKESLVYPSGLSPNKGESYLVI